MEDLKWKVQVKGSKGSGGWEISVVREDNAHGIRSWGWFDNRKILISHNGGPCNWPIPNYVFDMNVKLAEEVADALNAGCTYEEVMENTKDDLASDISIYLRSPQS